MARSYGRKHEGGIWVVAVGRNSFHNWVYSWADRPKEVQVAQSRSHGADVQIRVCLMAKVTPLLPLLLNMHDIFAPFCCPVIMWPTHWCWKAFHHRPPAPNPPSSLLLRGHSTFQLVSLIIWTSVLLTHHMWPWDSQSHVFQWLSSIPGAES